MTPFVISLETFARLKVFNFSEQYDATPSAFYHPRFLGGKDLATRQIQTNLFDAIRYLFGDAIMNGEIQIELKDETSSQKNVDIIKSFKVMAAMMLYIKHQIDGTYWIRDGANSSLGTIIRETLDPRQNMTERDIFDIFSGALRMIQSFDLDSANLKLKNNKLTPITEAQWRDFKKFCKSQTIKEPNPPLFKDYPVTSILKPLGESIGGAVGLTGGLVGGAVGSNSMPFMPANRALASAIKGSIIVLGLGSTFGAPIVAPVMAATLLSTFVQMFCARYFDYYTSKAGAATAMAISIPLDYVYRFFKDSACAFMKGENESNAISGLRLDGTLIINGFAVEKIIVTENDKDFENHQITDAVDEKSAQIAYEEVISELREQFQFKELEPNTTPSLSMV